MRRLFPQISAARLVLACWKYNRSVGADDFFAMLAVKQCSQSGSSLLGTHCIWCTIDSAEVFIVQYSDWTGCGSEFVVYIRAGKGFLPRSMVRSLALIMVDSEIWFDG